MLSLLPPLSLHRLARQLALPGFPLSPTCLDGGVLQRGRAQGHFVSPRHQQVQHVGVVKALHRLAVDVGDEVPRTEACFKCRTALIHGLRQDGAQVSMARSYMATLRV